MYVLNTISLFVVSTIVMLGSAAHAESYLPEDIPWTPEMVDTVLWLDAADTNTITDSSGAVSQWDDKSGADNHAIAVAGNEPISGSNTLNGLNVLAFDGSDDGSGDELGLTQNVSIESNLVFMVLQTDTPPAHGNSFALFGRKVEANETMFFYNPTGKFEMWAPSATDNFYGWNDRSATALARGSTGIVCIVGNPGADADLAINGTLELAAFAKRNPAGPRSDFGAIASTKNFEPREVDGVIAEVLVVPDVSTNTRQRVEGYLAWKWGLEGSLPGGHPYENAAPIRRMLPSWTVADMHSILWLDAADTNTITESAGLVSQWADKSGNDNHAIAVVGNEPISGSNSLYGLNVLAFDGDDAGGTANDELGLTQNVSFESNLVFMVLQTDTPAAHANAFSLFGRKGSDQKEPMFFYNPNGSFTMWGATDTFYKWNDSATSTLTRGDSGIVCVVGNPGGDADLVINGTVDSAAFGMRGIGDSPGPRSDFGAIASTKNFEPREVDGVIAEIVVVSDVSEETRQRIEGYLAWKWGMEGHLPDGHPYEEAPPPPPPVGTVLIVR